MKKYDQDEKDKLSRFVARVVCFFLGMAIVFLVVFILANSY